MGCDCVASGLLSEALELDHSPLPLAALRLRNLRTARATGPARSVLPVPVWRNAPDSLPPSSAVAPPRQARCPARATQHTLTAPRALRIGRALISRIFARKSRITSGARGVCARSLRCSERTRAPAARRSARAPVVPEITSRAGGGDTWRTKADDEQDEHTVTKAD